MRITATAIGETMETQIGTMTVRDIDVRYNPGGPFVRYLLDDTLEGLVRDMKQRIEEKRDNVVLIEGAEGSGKSNLALRICKAFDPAFTMETNLIYTMKQLRARLRQKGDRGQVFWLDELYDIASNRTWNSEETREFIKLLVKMRSRGWTLIMCIPRMKDSDEYIKAHRTSYHISCEPMGFEHSMYLKRGYFCLEKRRDDGGMQHVGYGRYPAMTKDEEAEYEFYKDRNQDDDLLAETAAESRGAAYKKKYEAETMRTAKAVLLLRDSGVPRDVTCEALKITQKRYYNLCERAKTGEVAEDDGDE